MRWLSVWLRLQWTTYGAWRAHRRALRALRIESGEISWEFEPTTLRARFREALCVLVRHRFVSGITVGEDDDGEQHVMEIDTCHRCGIRRYGQCLTHGTLSYAEDEVEDWED